MPIIWTIILFVIFSMVHIGTTLSLWEWLSTVTLMIGLFEVLTKNQRKALLHVSQRQRFANLRPETELDAVGPWSKQLGATWAIRWFPPEDPPSVSEHHARLGENRWRTHGEIGWAFAEPWRRRCQIWIPAHPFIIITSILDPNVSINNTSRPFSASRSLRSMSPHCIQLDPSSTARTFMATSFERPWSSSLRAYSWTRFRHSL